MTRFALNPDLDVSALAKDFAATGRVRIEQFLTPESAAALASELAASADWQLVLNSGSKIFRSDRAALEQMPPEQRAALDSAMYSAAASGFQFRYDAIRVPDEAVERQRSTSLLTEFAMFMGSAETLRLLSEIAQCSDLVFADAQATRYQSGDFLTRHDDNVAGKHRKLAYVLGLTSDWRAEWGGLLLFNDSGGGVVDTFVPQFNALSLFAVPQPHSVSCVAPYAPAARVSVTGWIRSKVP